MRNATERAGGSATTRPVTVAEAQKCLATTALDLAERMPANESYRDFLIGFARGMYDDATAARVNGATR
ncbi:hypothetical protein [Patulibacter defluvii]|uniref:hypothetical protein n=1 Tax=Patulibacter defluvii TaxID=3095358 RepID=UPI002A74E542|nr:hypothetical protein [Patulibacter sp. DM4]